MKKGTILITLGLLLITAALCLVGYNLYESYRAGEASEAIMSELEQAIQEGTSGDSSGDGSISEDESTEGSQPGSEVADASGTTGSGNSSNPSGNGGSNPLNGGTASANGESEEANLGELYPDRDMPSISVDSVGYIGYIFIPSLSIRLPVQGEWVYSMLDISPARYSGSVYQNNMIIGGHSYITHFRALRGIAPGARVVFYDAEGFMYEYEVEYVMSLNPNQGAILSDEEGEDWDLTLFTCNTGGQTRCIVRCARI